MSPVCLSCTCARPPATAAEWNAQIRDLVATTDMWTPGALAELARLRAGWRAATAREQLAAAA